MRTRVPQPITSLADHPNAAEIRALLARLPEVTDTQLTRLSRSWCDSPELALARDRALACDSPLVLDALATFDAVDDLFADDLAGRPWAAPIARGEVRVGLKAVRDAVAAAYARPVLTPAQHDRLMAPWHEVFPEPGDGVLDLGPRSLEIRRLLAQLDRLADRCHDPLVADEWAQVASRAGVRNDPMFDRARRSVWTAAQLTGRRRTRVAVRRLVADALSTPCPVCGQRFADDDPETDLVGGLWLDAMWGYLVADAVDDTLLDVLVLPLRATLDADPA